MVPLAMMRPSQWSQRHYRESGSQWSTSVWMGRTVARSEIIYSWLSVPNYGLIALTGLTLWWNSTTFFNSHFFQYWADHPHWISSSAKNNFKVVGFSIISRSLQTKMTIQPNDIQRFVAMKGKTKERLLDARELLMWSHWKNGIHWSIYLVLWNSASKWNTSTLHSFCQFIS